MSKLQEHEVDVLISVGGGSPIDASKVVAHHLHESTGKWIHSIAVPTTLSVAETTGNGGYTDDEGNKKAVSSPYLVPIAIIYDAEFALYTPMRLWLSTGMRAVDHALELLYSKITPEYPVKILCVEAAKQLFTYLPLCKNSPEDLDIRQKLFMAGYSALFPCYRPKGGLGLSHSMGHALGATYNIPHGITSCLTLSSVLKQKAINNPEEAAQIARAIEVTGLASSGDQKKDAFEVGNAVEKLVVTLGLKSCLLEVGFSLSPPPRRHSPNTFVFSF